MFTLTHTPFVNLSKSLTTNIDIAFRHHNFMKRRMCKLITKLCKNPIFISAIGKGERVVNSQQMNSKKKGGN